MQLWPGYVTSIRQHERDILVCAEITHKVMRMETINDILRNCLRVSNDYKATFHKLVLGTTVLTDYNNKTYRIDDIDYDHSPSSTFMTKDGPLSYVDYYKRVSFYPKFKNHKVSFSNNYNFIANLFAV